MSIADDSGSLRTRPAADERAEATRPDEPMARYANLDPGGGGGSLPAEPIPGDEVTGVITPDESEPIPGDEVTGVITNPPPPQPAPTPAPPPPERKCTKYVYYDEYRTAGDERVCPECGPLHGAWFESGFGPYPPLHDNCRCARVPIWWDCYYSDGEYGGGGRMLPGGNS